MSRDPGEAIRPRRGRALLIVPVLLALGLLAAAGVFLVRLARTDEAVRAFEAGLEDDPGGLDSEVEGETDAEILAEGLVARLGGEEAAARRLRRYLSVPDRAVPERWAPRRQAAAILLGFCGTPAGAKVAVPVLVRLLDDDDAVMRFLAAGSLVRIGPATVPALVDRLRGKTGDSRGDASGALGRIGAAHPGEAVPMLAAALGDADENVRYRVAEALGRIGAGAAGAVPALERALGDPDPFVRGFAADALGRIGVEAPEARPAVVPALAGALEDAEALTRLVAAGALGRIGPDAAGAVPALERLASGDPDERVRAAASTAADQARGEGR